MKKLQKLLALGLAAAGAAVLLTGCGKKALEDSDLEAASWDQITEAARDTTVTFYGWGGDENRNNWLNTTVADHVKENYGITLEVVGMDINDILTKLSGEKQAGSEKGSIDMIWINGENFYSAKDNGLLYGPFTHKLPNMEAYVDLEDPETLNDFCMPIEGYEARMAAARTMYHELSPETAEFIDFMQDNELFDVESRPGKMNGGYMTSLPSYKAPFIFANWNGTSADVDVLTHECGHAFEGYVAERDPHVPADLECPGMESAEIHSMAMEFLTAPWHKLLFGKDVDKYALQHAEDSFLFLAYGCIVDEFQHKMYQNPDLTPDERNAVWLELEHKYRPWVDFDNLPFYGRGAGWQRQLHIYECPFYYIDYCLSTMAALQFFLLSLKDHKDAWQRYLKLVRRAGTASYSELCETAGLKVPFTDGSIKAIAEEMEAWIAAHQA